MFIFVYRLAMDAKTWRGDGVAGGKCLSLLKDFQTGTASMARKRHLASTARGFSCFCLAPTTELIRSIRLIRDRISQQRWDFPGAPEFLSLLLERPNQGGGHAGQREDDATYLEHTVLALTVLLLGLHIYDVVLLQIEAG